MPRRTTTSSPADRIAVALIERLEAGVRPWVCPWRDECRPQPLRAGGEPYRGTNRFWLWLVAETQGYRSPYWMTYAQAATLGGQVRRGERSTPAVLFKPVPSKAEADDGAVPPRLILRSFAVFNADQIDGLAARFHPPAGPLPPWPDRCAAVDAFFQRLPGEVVEGRGAAYDRRADRILMPPRHAFADGEAYYATLAHEYAHWTGHGSRLARDFGARFGDVAYAVEELIAEMASAIIGAELGLPVDHIDSHAAYVASWIAVLRANSRVLFSVAAKAEAAAGYLLAAASSAIPARPGAGG